MGSSLTESHLLIGKRRRMLIWNSLLGESKSSLGKKECGRVLQDTYLRKSSYLFQGKKGGEWNARPAGKEDFSRVNASSIWIRWLTMNKYPWSGWCLIKWGGPITNRSLNESLILSRGNCFGGSSWLSRSVLACFLQKHGYSQHQDGAA